MVRFGADRRRSTRTRIVLANSSLESCPLSAGLLAGNTIMCQCHGSRFDVVTGAVINGPAVRPLNMYNVQEVNGTVRVRV
jgi:nitrite reductase/ring-hydroxylating ferredoxin subunit